MSKNIIRNVDGKVIGEVKGDLFIKKVVGSFHFLFSPPAIANDLLALQTADRLGAKVCLVIDKQTKKRYYAPFSTIYAKGFKIDRGHGLQIALPMHHWSHEYPAEQPSFL